MCPDFRLTLNWRFLKWRYPLSFEDKIVHTEDEDVPCECRGNGGLISCPSKACQWRYCRLRTLGKQRFRMLGWGCDLYLPPKVIITVEVINTPYTEKRRGEGGSGLVVLGLLGRYAHKESVHKISIFVSAQRKLHDSHIVTCWSNSSYISVIR